jgi:hypothetical protein
MMVGWDKRVLARAGPPALRFRWAGAAYEPLVPPYAGRKGRLQGNV